ncbi:hypothetical protein LAZ67_19002611 [Cordylochernes scorpioides]|uniref:Reverse transcriptase domain-containing protein n=1 Tax=Cordylochernes scorpioides TaxID=51811 RepID=A0ABY6LNH8_9ARAC|nr:hypothetical protein LAZ67_19002611 [Cordylochernes scorpioides]
MNCLYFSSGARAETPDAAVTMDITEDIGFALHWKMGAVVRLVTLEMDQTLVKYSKSPGGTAGSRSKSSLYPSTFISHQKTLIRLNARRTINNTRAELTIKSPAGIWSVAAKPKNEHGMRLDVASAAEVQSAAAGGGLRTDGLADDDVDVVLGGAVVRSRGPGACRRSTSTSTCANRLSEITKNLPHIVKNPEEILQKMKNFKLKTNHRIVSYDVKDLYTSLPHDLIMDSLKTILIKHKEAYPDHLAILKLTEICLKSTTVKFTEEYYNQIKGTPMGSPLSTILAEIVLSTIDSWITEIKPNEILIWSRYVDDIFCIITENSENHILETLNSFNSSIQFTIEKENNGSLPFLDILFTRNRTVYRKPTSPTQYLHFASNSPISHKITVVRTLTKRAFTHCSSKIEYNKELKSIENQLLKSG